MMMRFYNSRVEHIVTKNNEFFEQCDDTTLFYCYCYKIAAKNPDACVGDKAASAIVEQ